MQTLTAQYTVLLFGLLLLLLFPMSVWAHGVQGLCEWCCILIPLHLFSVIGTVEAEMVPVLRALPSLSPLPLALLCLPPSPSPYIIFSWTIWKLCSGIMTFPFEYFSFCLLRTNTFLCITTVQSAYSGNSALKTLLLCTY